MVYVLALYWFVLINNAIAITLEDPIAIAKKIQTVYENTKNFVADFEQQVYWRRGQEIRFSKGKVWFQKPGLMRWEYVWPEPMLIVSDGKNLYIYSQQDNQVMIFSLNKAVSAKLVLGFMNGKGNLLKDFVIITSKNLEGDKIALDLKPKIENSQVEQLRIVVYKKTCLIDEIWFWDCLGNLTKIRFLKFKRNVHLEDKLFNFVPPKGVEIIRENSS